MPTSDVIDGYMIYTQDMPYRPTVIHSPKFLPYRYQNSDQHTAYISI